MYIEYRWNNKKAEANLYSTRAFLSPLYSLLKRTQNKSHGDLGIHQASAYQHRERNDFKDMGGSNLSQGVN